MFTEAELLWAAPDAIPEKRSAEDGNSNQSQHSRYPRLSRPVPMIRPEYDVVVVGSGYGGGVAASRMARAEKRVAVLELGKEKWPGEYPSSLADAMPELHVSGNASNRLAQIKDTEFGKRTGLYHLVLGQGQNAFVGNGRLGGTSLLNANVFLQADSRTLAMSEWPSELRKDGAALAPYYKRAADMLQPSPYPTNYPLLHKLNVLEKQARALGQEQNFYRVPQTTFFHDGLNAAGVEMKASTGSGQDCTGVNDGSKNSVLMNYIPDAWNWGAEIFCECEVRYIRRDEENGGYVVFFAWHGDDRNKFGGQFYSDLMWVRAKELCFLAAGSLGTTEILLRSKSRGLKMSRMVGQKMSGNGDMLSFGYNTDEEVNGVGQETPSKENPPGPTIAGIIDNRGPETSPNVLDGYCIQEGCIPAALTPVIRAMLQSLPKDETSETSTLHAFRQLLSRTQTIFRGPYSKGSSLNRTQTYLIMSHDSNEAILSLENDKPYLQFLGVGRTQHVKKLNEVLVKATAAIGGTLVKSPFESSREPEAITVHPLGGAIMSKDGTGAGGVTNHLGQVFAGDGSELHDGLVCIDGSIVPVALGVNPFATITALAERSIDLLALQRGWAIDQTPNGRLDLFGKPKRSFSLTPEMVNAQSLARLAPKSGGVRFTEILEGHLHIGDNIGDFAVAESVAKGSSSSARLYLSVETHSVENLTQSSNPAPSLTTGTLSCAALSQDPLLVLRGQVQFFSVDQTLSDATNFVYKLTLLSTRGEILYLTGCKKLDSNMSWSISNTWKATTTLYTTLSRDDGSLAGRGVLRISWRNFESELKSFAPTTSEKGLIAGLVPTLGFLGYFARSTANYFLGPFRDLEYARNLSTNGYLPKTPPAETVTLTAKDGVQTTIRVWNPQAEKSAGRKLPLLFFPGAAVTHEIFALPTIEVNTVEYFTSRGYTVYVPNLRFGAVPSSEVGYTAYEARLDVRAAAEFVRSRHDGRKMYVLCHCVGAIATASAILDGTLPASWLQGLTASQVFLAQWVGAVNALAARTSSLTKLYTCLSGNPFYETISPPSSPLLQQALDQALRFYPVGAPGERCNSAVCHRLSFVFSRLWVHANLTHSTHSQLANFVGSVHMRLLSHLMAGARAAIEAQAAPRNQDPNIVLDGDGGNMVTQEGVERLRGLPIQFVCGGANVVFTPEATSLAYDLVRDRFGPDLYRRRVVPKYGHLDLWMGSKADVDVYPLVEEHVRWCEERGPAS
ncbi:hypothetical protein IWZ00DRAFT_443295 [Phyllosticta capitalensis]